MFTDRKFIRILSLIAVVAAVSLWVGMSPAKAEEGLRLSLPEGKLSQQLSRQSKQEYQTAQSSRCRYADSPKYCPRMNWCCPYEHTHVCRGYRGYHQPYRQYGRGTFCVRPGSSEDWADLSQNCAVFVAC